MLNDLMLEHFPKQMLDILHLLLLPPVLLHKLFSEIGDLLHCIERWLVLELLDTRRSLVESVECALIEADSKGSRSALSQ